MKIRKAMLAAAVSAAILGLGSVSVVQSADAPIAAAAPAAPTDNLLDEVDLRDVPLRDALSLIGQSADINLAATDDAAKTRVTLHLRNVTADVAVQTLCQTNGLFYKKPTDQNVGIVTTIKEFQEGLTVFREEKTQVFTLLYPNAVDLAVAIHDLYGDRVRLSLGNEYDESDEIQKRFAKFDLVDQRGQQSLSQLTTSSGGSTTGGFGSTSSSGSYTPGSSASTISGMSSAPPPQEQNNSNGPPNDLRDLTPEQASRVAAILQQQGNGVAVNEQSLNGLARNNAAIYVSVISRNNQVIVRTSDPGVLNEITELKNQIDVPTPQVLLEVKVLSVDLTDGLNSVFDYEFGDQNQSASFSTGDIEPPPTANAPSLTIGGTGESLGSPFALNTNSLIYQWVSDNFRARIQLLETHNKVTELATPLLLVANNEVSKIFVGQERPIVQAISSQTNQVANAGTSNTSNTAIDIEPIGTTLLITPNINADRTVTLRLTEEQSSVITGGATIPIVVNSTGAVINQPVDVVSATSVTGTLIAKDGLSLALGGLIDETVQDQREEVPVLGHLPVLGFLFQRSVSGRTRNEIIVVIRPFILSTPSEAEEAGKRIIEASSIHPKSPELFPAPGQPIGTMHTFLPDEALRPHPPRTELEKIFQFHTILPTDY